MDGEVGGGVQEVHVERSDHWPFLKTGHVYWTQAVIKGNLQPQCSLGLEARRAAFLSRSQWKPCMDFNREYEPVCCR